ncbi:hypothetical protein V8C34DRAFT_8024 [Trichoderma compactum]
MVWPMCEMRLVPIEHCCRWCLAQPTLHSGTRRRATAASPLVARRQNTERMDCADICARYVSTGDEDDNEDDDGEEEEEEEEGDEEEEEEGDAEEAADGADAPVNGAQPPHKKRKTVEEEVANGEGADEEDAEEQEEEEAAEDDAEEADEDEAEEEATEAAEAAAPAKEVKAPEVAKATDTPEPKAVTAGGDE